MTRLMPAYFLSHGGPPTMFETSSPAYQAWKGIGRDIKRHRPKGLVVVSAHWENDQQSSGVKVNVDQSNPLIYDFYGFPKHFYEQTFESHGTDDILGHVRAALYDAQLAVGEERRGLDHGVWVPFKVAFDGATDIPIVQVSLPGDASPHSTAVLGRALRNVREQGYIVVGTGQVVHNLRDAFSGKSAPYAKPFQVDVSKALRSAQPVQSVVDLFRHKLYKQAHPTPEHLLPLVFTVASTLETDQCETVYDDVDAMGLGWGMWKWETKTQTDREL